MEVGSERRGVWASDSTWRTTCLTCFLGRMRAVGDVTAESPWKKEAGGAEWGRRM